MTVRKVEKEDSEIWSKFRTYLWPKTNDNHFAEISDFFSGTSIDIEEVFVIENDLKQVVGFIELNTREFAEGSRHPLVPYVEAWYVDAKFRGRGYGKKLMEMAEIWAGKRGFSELASDTEVTNTKSIMIHKKLGFEETERVVCFIKTITKSTNQLK